MSAAADSGNSDERANSDDAAKSISSSGLAVKATVHSIFGLRPHDAEDVSDTMVSADALVRDAKQYRAASQHGSMSAHRGVFSGSEPGDERPSNLKAAQPERVGLLSTGDSGRTTPKEAPAAAEKSTNDSNASPATQVGAYSTSASERQEMTPTEKRAHLNLDRSELWKLRKVFDAHDPQHRGLGLDEFYQFIHEYFPEAAWNDVAFVFRLFDVEQNGRLSLRDFMCGYAIICHASGEDRLRLCFAMVDRDASGLLDERQVAQALHLLSNYADLLAQFSPEGHHGHQGNHAVGADDLIDMARSIVRSAREKRAIDAARSDSSNYKESLAGMTGTDLDANAKVITFEEFLSGALQSQRIQHWLADVARVVGDEQPSLRDQKEVEMIALEIERLGLIQSETNLVNANATSESRASLSDASIASPAPVSRSFSSSLEEYMPHGHDAQLAARRGRSRESSQRGGTLYLSQSFSNVPLLEQMAQRQAQRHRTAEVNETQPRASTPKPRAHERSEKLAFSSPRRLEVHSGAREQGMTSDMSTGQPAGDSAAAVQGSVLDDGSGGGSVAASTSQKTSEEIASVPQHPETDDEGATETLAKASPANDPATVTRIGSLLTHSPFVIEYNALKFERKIGEGSFSEVWAGEWLHLPVAIKVFKRFDPSITGTWSVLDQVASDQQPCDDSSAPAASAVTSETTRKDILDADSNTPASSDTDSESFIDEMTLESAIDDTSLIAGIDEDILAGVSTQALSATNTGQPSPRRTRPSDKARMPLLDENPQQLDRFNLVSFVREVELLSQLRHPNVLLYMGATADPQQPLCIISELFPGGSVHDLLFKRRKRLSKRQKFRIAVSVARGMLYLHSSRPQILHRDLKSSNVLIDESINRIAICDFGLSALRKAGPGDSESFGRARDADAMGTPYTLAPEVMAGESYTDKADVYSYGIVLWELLAAKRPFENLMPIQLMYKVYAQNARPPLGEVYAEFQPLLSQCWERDPLMRPDFGTILDLLENIGEASNLEDTSDEDDDNNRSLQSSQMHLMNAVAQNDLKAVKSLLDRGISPQFCDYDQRTPLHIAAAEGYVDIAVQLLQHGADVNARDRWGSTPLSEAIRFRHEHCAEILRDEYGGRIFDRKSHFELIDAVARGDIAAVRSFIQEGVDVRQADYDRRTALHLAAAEGYTKVAHLLIEAGADVLATDRWGSTPLQEAIRFKHPETAVYLEAVTGAQMRRRMRPVVHEGSTWTAASSLGTGMRSGTPELEGVVRGRSSPAPTSPANVDYYGD
ncbi:hypothetical protein CCYA_CCYA05G1688 [Cyanidiococcus yangmingshanensis]|nr:hypothetical protein CCYA_CCYA05G1688 [Cyanidiococcus yangmingshanensis]